jgi:hypothetical protein
MNRGTPNIQQVTGGSVERYIKDVDHVNSPEEYEICAFFPVTKE